MKKIIFAFFLLAAALVQSTLIHSISIFGVKPDLYWVMVMCAALYFEAGSAVIFSLVCGVLKDCLGTSSFGVYIVIFPLWSVCVSNLLKRISFEHPAVSGSALAIMIAVNAVILRLMPFIPDGPLPFTAFLRVSVIESVYTALFFIWISPFIKRVSESRRW
ncbi:MAG: rod shape-determining protein MreD [Candidatus Omnitrophota bacterium]